MRGDEKVVDIASGDRMEKADKDYLEFVYRDAREVIALTDNVQKSEAKIIDKMIQNGCYANSDTDTEEAERAEKHRAWLVEFWLAQTECFFQYKAALEEEEAELEYGENQIDVYRTAVRWMALVILGLVILNLFGFSSVWEVFF